MKHCWHPYNGIPATPSPLSLSHTDRHHLVLKNGTKLLDGIASWWTSIFGYNHPMLVDAIQQQSKTLCHAMFAGITHEPAERLANKLAQQLPSTPAVFLSDSGSVAVEVALKMARQYWQALGRPNKKRMLALRSGYHGDTWGAMSVSDPDTLHQQFRDASKHTYFIDAPAYGLTKPEDINAYIETLRGYLSEIHTSIAACILEPIWQGAGAMNFYHADYLLAIRQLCDEFSILLICDEIATGFGKTGSYFAHQHANIQPDIICLGKALSGGMMTLAATCTSQAIADAISHNPPYRFMHGPTYMANPLACACANSALTLLDDINWAQAVMTWQSEMRAQLTPLQDLEAIRDVRVLGHVAVIECHDSSLAAATQNIALSKGVWIRPFGPWVYLTPAYTMPAAERAQLLEVTLASIQEATLAHPKKTDVNAI